MFHDVRRRVPRMVRAPADTLATRLRRGLAEAGLEGCRQGQANELLQILDEVDREEALVRRAAALAEARAMRDAITLVLALLGELDGLAPEEPDASAFAEIAGLFADIHDFASHGAAQARLAAGLPLAP